MLPFRNPLTNDDPLSEAEMLAGLQHWYMGVVLVLGNLFGIPLTVYTYNIRFYFVSAVALGSIIISMMYHLCQTTQVCFFIPLPRWVLMDHVSAPVLCAIIILFIINTRSTKQLERQQREAANLARRRLDEEKKRKQIATPKQLPRNTITRSGLIIPMRASPKTPAPRQYSEESDDEESESSSSEEEYLTEKAKPYYTWDVHGQENFIYDGWSSYVTYFAILVAVCAAIQHPFSMEAFIIVIVLCLFFVFIKICIIDAGYPENMVGRVSLPELLVGIILIIIALVVFVLDSYVYYWLLHTLWHVLVYIGMYFFVIGLSRNTPYWYSIWTPRAGCCAPGVTTYEESRMLDSRRDDRGAQRPARETETLRKRKTHRLLQ